MYLSTTTQNDVANLIVKYVRENAADYVCVIEADQADYPDAVVVLITMDGGYACTAKVIVHHHHIVYASKLGTLISHPADLKDAVRIVGGLLLLEED